MGVEAVARAEKRLALLKEAAALAARLRAHEEERARLLDERARQCRDLRQAGVSIEELQDVLGVSRSRIHQILRAAHT